MERALMYARIQARVANRSQPIRETVLLAQQHPNVFGLVPLRLSGSEHLQAVALGRLDDQPQVVMALDPFDPRDPWLDPLGEFLEARLRDPRGCQVWVPDAPSFRALVILGLRSRRNRRASPLRQQLGVCLVALSRLHPLAGQQAMVIATEVLAAHLITGQGPSEDAHLAARLAWDAPRPGENAAEVAIERFRRPSPSLLLWDDENDLESIRDRLRAGKGGTFDRGALASYLTSGALQGWKLLAQAFEVFGGLRPPPLPGLPELEGDSRRELAWLLRGAPDFDRHLGRACAELAKREYWRARLEDLNARGDAIWRELLRREGRVVAATTVRAEGDRLDLRTRQESLRVRPGTRLKSADGRVEAVVESIGAQAEITLLLRVTRGKTASPVAGTDADWFDTVVFRGKPLLGAPLADVPPARPLAPLAVPDDLVALAGRLRQP